MEDVFQPLQMFHLTDKYKTQSTIQTNYILWGAANPYLGVQLESQMNGKEHMKNATT